jgi:hypothetical protein
MYVRARRGISYLPQEPSVFRKLSVEENILAILETLPLTREERRAYQAAERLREPGLARDLARDGVGRVVVVRGRLQGELAAGREEGGEAREEGLVIRHPVDGRVREHDVEAAPREGAEVATDERDPAARVGGGPLQHRGGGVHPEGLARPEPLVREPGQLARPAAEVHDARRRGGLHEGEQIEERRGPLRAEFPVLVGAPDVGQTR